MSPWLSTAVALLFCAGGMLIGWVLGFIAGYSHRAIRQLREPCPVCGFGGVA